MQGNFAGLFRAPTLGRFMNEQQPEDSLDQTQEQLMAPVSAYERSRKQAYDLVEIRTEQCYQVMVKNQFHGQAIPEESQVPFKTYLQDQSEYLRLQSEMVALGVKPEVAALALFSTNFVSTSNAMDLIYDRQQEGPHADKMQHEYLGYLVPSAANQPIAKDSQDIEMGQPLELTMVCYICGNSESEHPSERDLEARGDPQDMVLLRQVTLNIQEQGEQKLGEEFKADRNELMATFQRRLTMTRAKIEEAQAKAAEENVEEGPYCPICYTNVLPSEGEPVPEGDHSCIELECSHRFCSDCTTQQLKTYIENSELSKIKCFEFECQKPITSEKIKDILESQDKTDLYAKYVRFKDKKSLDSDPLVRWCTKPGCETHIRAENASATKLACGNCGTEVCFKCRDNWHGEVSCEDAMKKQLEGWVEENKGNVSFCPMCRTRIEKNKGCNHMTCAFCKYEFCWACGGSASGADNHFGFRRGCGVKMMDESVKPGDRGEKPNIFIHILKVIARFILTLLLFPFILVLAMPVSMAYQSGRQAYQSGGWPSAILCGIFGFIIGLILNVCFIPLYTIIFILHIIVLIIEFLRCILCCRCAECFGFTQNEEAAEANRRQAEQRMKDLMAAGQKPDADQKV